MSAEHPNATEELAQVLADRFSGIAHGWKASAPEKRMEDLEKILAARNVAAALPSIVTESDALLLLKLDDPLQAIADQWLKLTGLDHPQDGALRCCVAALCAAALRQDIPQMPKKQKAHCRESKARWRGCLPIPFDNPPNLW